MKRLRGWDIIKSPVVYEVLLDPNGKCLLIGNCDDFCDFAAMYFDIGIDPPSSTLASLALANKAKYSRNLRLKENSNRTIFNISIINAPIPLLNLILARLVSPVSSMTPPGVLVNLKIFDEFTANTDHRILDGMLMELEDAAAPILAKVAVSPTLPLCLKESDLIIWAEDLTRNKCEEDKDWIQRIDAKIAGIVQALNDNLDCRIFVGGEGPQCYIAEVRSITVLSEGQLLTTLLTLILDLKKNGSSPSLRSRSHNSIWGIHSFKS